jgi:hypothetical protein
MGLKYGPAGEIQCIRVGDKTGWILDVYQWHVFAGSGATSAEWRNEDSVF